MLLIIDNYDSFTYNLVQYLGELGETVRVYRNDAITLEAIALLQPGHIVISPGPCTPRESGISLQVIQNFAGKIPLLGICLGHQCIGQVFGGEVVRAERLMHGKNSKVYHDGRSIYQGLKNPFSATRYHSLILDRKSLPDCFEVSAQTDHGEIMGIRHRQLLVEGVQFHPEAILTEQGKNLLANFLRI